MIGFFDSGIGGLNYLREFELISNEPTLYYCDDKNLPFGSKTPAQICQITVDGVQHLFDEGCNLVILACNTASVRSIRYIQQQWLPNSPYSNTHQVLGISTPFLEYIEEKVLNNERCLVLATPATISSAYYQEYLDKRYHAVNYLAIPELAFMVENKIQKDQIITYLKETFEQNKIFGTSYNHILLACTHYHNVQDVIQDLFPQAIVHNHMSYCANKLVKYLNKYPKYTSSDSNPRLRL